MTPLFRKLNLKDQQEIVVLDAPAGFEAELDALDGVAIRWDAGEADRIAFALAFVTTLSGVESAAAVLLPKAEGDAVIWFAYPKATSKRYRCEFNRDRGWDALGRAGFETVRQVAIDEDWSALRFRRTEYVKTMKRAPERAVSEAGKARTAPESGES